MNRIILASSSPRRIEILKRNGIDPIIIPPSGADETLPLMLKKEQAVMYLALKKALYSERAYLNEYKREPNPTVLIAADTIVYKHGIIGKPKDREDAETTLKLLRNASHYVITGVALLKPGQPKRLVFYDLTEVVFKNYSDDEIQNYLNTDEPWDKAGSYAIQGSWARNISHINGNYDNVIGFPWNIIEKVLSEFQL